LSGGAQLAASGKSAVARRLAELGAAVFKLSGNEAAVPEMPGTPTVTAVSVGEKKS